MWPFDRKPAAQPVVHVAQPIARSFDPIALQLGGLRKGMWVLTPDGVGILTGLTADHIAQVMLTTNEGTNLLSITLPAAKLEQAALDDIPAPRRPTPDAGARLGYFKRGQN